MLMPKRTKWRRMHRLSHEGKAKSRLTLSFGKYGLRAEEGAWITAQQIEASRIAFTHYTKRSGKVWMNIFPDMPLSKKPLEVRMGSGKGAPEQWVAVVKAGTIMFEMDGISEADAREAFRLAGHKLPIKTSFVKREDAVKPQGGVDNGINQ